VRDLPGALSTWAGAGLLNESVLGELAEVERAGCRRFVYELTGLGRREWPFEGERFE